MGKFLLDSTSYALMHNHINEMVQGEKISREALVALGMTGQYHPRHPLARGKIDSVNAAADFLLSGFSNPTSRDPEKYHILHNNGDGTFTRK